MDASKPVKVRLRPRAAYEGDECLMLGPILLCSEASAWLRKTFPRGASFKEAWEECRRADWIGYVADALNRSAGAGLAHHDVCPTCMGMGWREADRYRARIPYERVEGWLRKVMRGRPEVIE